MNINFLLRRCGIAAAIWFLGYPAFAAPPTTNVIQYTPGLTIESLSGRPDTDLVQFPKGKPMTVGQIRRLQASAARLRAPRVDRTPEVLRHKPAPTGMPLRNASDLKEALKRPDTETVQFPSGRTATVGQIRLVRPLVEKRLGGRSLDSLMQRPSLSGPAIKVSKATTRKEWTDILKKPDTTVVETQSGKRATVGEIKEEGKRQLSARGKSGDRGKPGAAGPAAQTRPSKGVRK